MKKEDVGRIVKKAARLIPGIGSYQDRESLRDADKTLRTEIARRLDELIGVLEWVKTDQLKKGGWKRIKDLDELEKDVETASKTIERAARGFGSMFDGPKVDEETLERVYEYDKGMWELVDPIDKAIRGLTEKGKVPDQATVEAIRKDVRELISKITNRDRILKGLAS
ncbi:MAG: hypothetical protein DRH12_10330 [Deltaproteobacteria bacterium]|nr:MAG: hypothetical protein DRH12_10330 [Deltaproteobacteria bacterium]RLB76125.1 MAG: hypothetical protein DRH15_13050 [Deltaproteobacteria bacterium]